MKPSFLLRRARVATWCLVLGISFYAVWRFELVRLPEGSCSPLLAVSAGERLWIDLHPDEVRPGDVVLFGDPAGESLLLGRVEIPPASLPAEALDALARGALWIVGDHPSCPARDSRLLGPIPRDGVAGRLLFAW